MEIFEVRYLSMRAQVDLIRFNAKNTYLGALAYVRHVWLVRERLHRELRWPDASGRFYIWHLTLGFLWAPP